MNLDRIIRHTVMFHLLTSTYIPNFIGIGKTFCGQTDVWTDGHLRPTLLGRLSRSRPNYSKKIVLKLFQQEFFFTVDMPFVMHNHNYYYLSK